MPWACEAPREEEEVEKVAVAAASAAPREEPGAPTAAPGSCQEAASRVSAALALVPADASAANGDGAVVMEPLSPCWEGASKRSVCAAATEANSECLQGYVVLGTPLDPALSGLPAWIGPVVSVTACWDDASSGFPAEEAELQAVGRRKGCLLWFAVWSGRFLLCAGAAEVCLGV